MPRKIRWKTTTQDSRMADSGYRVAGEKFTFHDRLEDPLLINLVISTMRLNLNT